MAITNHVKGAVEKFKAKTGIELKDYVLNATYLNGLEGTSYVDLTSDQTITGTKNFDTAYANVFATGTGAGNYFQCKKFRGEGNASTYYHALDFGYAGHNQWDFFEYGGVYNFYQNTSADSSGKVNLFRISPGGVTSHKPLIAESTLTAKGAFTSNTSTTLSSVKSAGILGTDSTGKVYDNSSAYQKAGDYATKSDLNKYQPAGSYQPKGDYVPFDNASKDIYLGSHGIYSGVRPSSGGVTMTGNGYWIEESSVGVSSAVSGGVAVSSTMTPDYISVHNGKIKINSSGIVSDSGTFTFDGNPGSVATTDDLKNYQKKGNYVTIDTAQTISAKKTFSATPELPAIKNKKVIGTDANGLIEAHTLGIDDITDLKTQLNGKQPSGAYAERQSAQTITGNWTFTGTTNFNGTTKVNGNEIASKGYVDGLFDSKLDASEATNFAKFTKFDSDTLKMTGARLYRTSANDAVDRSSMYGYSSQNTYGTTYTRFAGIATIGSSQAFIGYYQYTNHADGSGGAYIGNITLSNGRLARINGSLSSVNELTDAYAVLSDLNNKANKTHTHAISDITNLQSTLNGKANASHTHTISQINTLQDALDRKQNIIEYPCSFDTSGSNNVKLSRDGTSNYYVYIQRGTNAYNASSQYPDFYVSFPYAFNGAPTVVVTFSPTSNSTGAVEAIKALNVTSTGFHVTTKMSATVSSGYFRINWIAIYTV